MVSVRELKRRLKATMRGTGQRPKKADKAKKPRGPKEKKLKPRLDKSLKTKKANNIRPIEGAAAKTGQIEVEVERREDKHDKIKDKIKSLFVDDLMTKNVVAIASHNSLEAIVDILRDRNITNIPVMEYNKVVGVVGKNEILKIANVKDLEELNDEHMKKIRETPVHKIMRKPVLIHFKSPISDATALMKKTGNNLLIVVDKRKNVMGVISKTDIFRGASRIITQNRIETSIDEVLEMLKKKGSVTIDEIVKKFHVDRQTVEEWGKILEEHHLAIIEYPVIGKAYLAVVKDTE